MGSPQQRHALSLWVPRPNGEWGPQGDLAPLALNLVAEASASLGAAIYPEVLILFRPKVIFALLFLEIRVNSRCAGFAIVEEGLAPLGALNSLLPARLLICQAIATALDQTRLHPNPVLGLGVTGMGRCLALRGQRSYNRR
jgi:hypothetical protein